MAGISFTRNSESSVQYQASGLTRNSEYAVQIYSSANGKWYVKDSFKATSTRASGSFTVDSAGSYSGRLWDYTLGREVASATIPAYDSTIYVYAECADGVSQFTLVYDGRTTLVRSTAGIVPIRISKVSRLSVQSVYALPGYDSPYLLYYNTGSDPYGWHGPTSFTGSISISDVSFDRRIKVGATQSAVYPYRQIVYIDGNEVSDATNSTYSENHITISDLSNYSYYINQGYVFHYATVGSSSIRREASYSVPLTANSTTVIRLYFKSNEHSVKPGITTLRSTVSTVAVTWTKNGATQGTWTLHYGPNRDNLQYTMSLSSSPATVTGLQSNTKYYFMIRHRCSASDYKDSTIASISTKLGLTAFAWTDNDAVKIKAQQPVSNLTAASWNNLIAKIRSCGGDTTAIPSATSGDGITANHFNQMRNAIAKLSGAGSVAGAVSSNSTIQATLFANASSALKEAINRVISIQNS